MQLQKFEMVLLDIPMQDRSAEEFIKGMKADNALRGIPLIILADPDQLDEAEICIKAGAEDYVVLPFSPVVLKARVSTILERQRVRIAEQILIDTMKYERDMQIGQQIQLNFLPEMLPQPPGWEISARCEPAFEVAGDFYDSFTLSDNYISIIVGDVCDKGIKAALFMALFRSLLRAFTQQDYSARLQDRLDEASISGSSLEQQNFPSLGRLILKNAIELTNNYVVHNHNSTKMLATLFFGILDPISGKLIYINAGYEPPLIINQGEVKARLKPTGSAIGIVPDIDHEIQQTQLDPGDSLLIYSDGIIEAKNPSGQSFGRQRILALLEKSDLSAGTLLSRIETNIHAHIAETTQLDDLTMLVVRRPA